MEVLLFTVGKQRCALPLADVTEVMRRQPLTGHGTLTPGVLGTAIIRRQPTPVVDAGQLLSGEVTTGERFVLLRAARGPVALAVDNVLGTALLSETQLAAVPALLTGNRSVVEAIGVLDAELIHLLSAVRVLDEPESMETAAERRDERSAAGV